MNPRFRRCARYPRCLGRPQRNRGHRLPGVLSSAHTGTQPHARGRFVVMTRSPDSDPQRGPRRYGPSSSNQPHDRPDTRRPAQPPAPYAASYGTPPRDVPPRAQPQQAWSQLPDRTAVYPPGVLGYDDGGPQGGQAPPRPRASAAAVQRPQSPANYRPSSDDRPHRTPGLIVAGRIIAAVLSVAVLAGFAFAWGFANKATGAVATGNDDGQGRSGRACCSAVARTSC